MIEQDLAITNKLGLHARAAAKFVRLASSFRSRVLVERDETTVDGKSILGLLALAAAQHTRLRLSADGDDAQQALTALQQLIADRFGEGR